MSALMLLRGLSFSTRNICSSLSKEMKLPNQERFASLSGRRWLEEGQEGAKGMNSPFSPPSPLFSSLSDSLWRGLWRQTGHLLCGGDWGGRGGHGQHLSIILASSTQASSRLQLGGPDPVSIHLPVAKHPQMTGCLMFLLGLGPH